ncbi:MAG: bacteriohopanetetrol glucosamine biosynthesis glycosyltransferase HpnI [Methylocella sp.]
MTAAALVSALRWTSDLFMLGAMLGCFYTILASAFVLGFNPRKKRSPARANIPVSILKPLHGDEPGLSLRLASFFQQDYDAPVQIVFGARDSADPAVAVAKRLHAACPDTLDLMVSARSHGSNPKVSNLINMIALARYDTLVIADSDIEVDAGYLTQVIDKLAKPGVGAVTCLYHGIAGPGIWARLACMAINTQFLASVIVALKLRLSRPCFGSTIAIRRDILSRIGGLAAFADRLADDYAIGKAVRAAGYYVDVPALSVGHMCCERGVREALAHGLRFARTIKSIDPVGYAGTVITHPFPLALIGTTIGRGDLAFVVVLALTCRLVLCRCVEHAFGLARHPYLLLPLHDLMSFGVYIGSFCGVAVRWKGHRYRITAGATLVKDPS